ncbi:unnamed protein product [Fraxinus pennsylvanica]|uniref:DUF7138 domain-containing protein n=1 Tax=Fraxinus pennsylvanica TaxID=56036 RepID=A0AAD2A2I7_9LAMI|nr:unnamed protein product [Fraxinus pennsylvanica]
MAAVSEIPVVFLDRGEEKNYGNISISAALDYNLFVSTVSGMIGLLPNQKVSIYKMKNPFTPATGPELELVDDKIDFGLLCSQKNIIFQVVLGRSDSEMSRNSPERTHGVEGSNNLENNMSAEVPVVFFDGKEKKSLGNISISPALDYKLFMSTVGQIIGILPNQEISIYHTKNPYVPETCPDLTPVDEKIDFGLLCSQKDITFEVVLERSDSKMSRDSQERSHGDEGSNILENNMAVEIPVVVFDGDDENNFGNISISPATDYKLFVSTVGHFIGTLPNQKITIYHTKHPYARATGPELNPVEEKTDFGLLCSQKDIVFLVVLGRSGSEMSRNPSERTPSPQPVPTSENLEPTHRNEPAAVDKEAVSST